MKNLLKNKLFVVPVILAMSGITVALVGTGCRSKSSESSSGGGSGSDTPAADLTAFKEDGRGTLEGRVTLDGADNDAIKKKSELHLAAMKKNEQDVETCCTKATPEDQRDETWVVAADGGLANVVVWVKPPDGQYFKLSDEDKKPKKQTLGQPFCAFRPHVFVLFPKYYDEGKKKLVETGQELEVTNESAVAHNTNMTGGRNPQLASGKSEQLTSSVKEITKMEKAIDFSCNVHPWMKAYAFPIDHPFAAVTDKSGNFKIENVPAGSKLKVQTWHETGSKVSKEVEIKKGETAKVTFEIKYK